MKSTATDTSIERPVGEAGLGGASLAYGIVAGDRQASRAVSVQAANVRRNAGGVRGHVACAGAAREACWALLEQHVTAGARVAVVGAGNGDDLSLARLARRAGALDLIDLDGGALRRARRRCALTRTPVGVLVDDVSGGVADRIVAGALGESVDVPAPPRAPVGGGPYDVVIADLVATQLLYPALVDPGLPPAHIDATLLADGQGLTEAVTARLHAAAPGGVVIHLHDLLGWWHGHDQPFTLDAILGLAETDPAAALTVAGQANAPYGCDARAASVELGGQVIDTTFWRWPFAPGTDYLVCATVVRPLPMSIPSKAGVGQ